MYIGAKCEYINHFREKNVNILAILGKKLKNYYIIYGKYGIEKNSWREIPIVLY